MNLSVWSNLFWCWYDYDNWTINLETYVTLVRASSPDYTRVC
jgi:hypothetical protein